MTGKKKAAYNYLFLFSSFICIFISFVPSSNGLIQFLEKTNFANRRYGSVMDAFYQLPSAPGTVGKRMLVHYGGTDGANNYNDLWFYDVAADTWEQQLANNAPPRNIIEYCGCVAGPYDDPKLYIFGGFNTTSSKWVQTLYSIRLASPSDGWIKIPTTGTPPARSGCTAIAYHSNPTDMDSSDTFYVFGGNAASGYLADLYSYDTAVLNWNSLGSYGDAGSDSAREFTAAAQKGTEIYFFGGLANSGAKNDLFFFDVMSQSFTTTSAGTTVPRRYGHLLALYDNTIWIYGGTDSSTYHADVWQCPTVGIITCTDTGYLSTVPAERFGSAFTQIAVGIMGYNYAFFAYGGNTQSGAVQNFLSFNVASPSFSCAAMAPICSDNGVIDALRNCQCNCNAGFGGTDCSSICPICVNGATTNACSCNCYNGWIGPTCAIPTCTGISCSLGVCVSDPSLCVTNTTSSVDIITQYSEPILSMQVFISSTSENTFTVVSASTGQPRVTVTIPADAFEVLDGTGQEDPNQNATQIQINSVDVDYLSSLKTPVTQILSNVFDISFQANVRWKNATVTFTFTVANRSATVQPEECLAFVDTSTGDWTCIDSELTGTTTTRTGTTTHFTTFGVLVSPTNSGGDSGDGSGGFDSVLIAPIVICVVFAIFVVLVVIIVGVVLGIIIRKRRRSKFRTSGNLASSDI